MTTKKVADIRETLPEAIKGGTASKPVWTIGNECFEFKTSLKKTGLDKEGHKPNLGPKASGRLVVAKFNAGKTAKGAPLMFVGVFRKVDGVVAATEAPEGETAPAPEGEAAPAPVETPVEGEGTPVEAEATV